jgi:hypothetical protein
MKIIILRLNKLDNCTISEVYVNGSFFGYSLEDRDRGLRQDMPLKEIMAIKVKGATAIPTGTYNVVFTWSKKFRKDLPLVENVPGYSGIRFHPGNSDKDTEGCIMYGQWHSGQSITASKLYTYRLNGMIEAAIKRGETVTLEIH